MSPGNTSNTSSTSSEPQTGSVGRNPAGNVIGNTIQQVMPKLQKEGCDLLTSEDQAEVHLKKFQAALGKIVISEPWSKVLKETAANYWAKHLNAASVSVAALVHGLDADFVKEARKPELVLRLVNEEHEPLSLDEIRAGFSPASSDLQDEPEQDETAGAPRRDGESEARAPEKSPAVFNFSEG